MHPEWAPCHSGGPLADTSIRRESAAGRMSRRKTLVAIRAPASRHMRAAARSKGAPSTPEVGQAAQWSPNASSCPPHRQRRGAYGSGARRHLSKRTRIQSLGMRNSGAAGSAMMARGPPGPACDKRRARDAGSRSRRRLSSAIVSKRAAAGRCQPRGRSPNSRPLRAWVGRSPPINNSHCGEVKPELCRRDAAFANAAVCVSRCQGYGRP